MKANIVLLWSLAVCVCTSFTSVRTDFVLTVNLVNYTNPTGLYAERLFPLSSVRSADQLIPVCCNDRPFRNTNCNNTGEERCDTRFRWTIRPFGASLETRPLNNPVNPPYFFTDCTISPSTCPFSEMSTTFGQGPAALLGVTPNPLPVSKPDFPFWTGQIQFFIEAIDTGLPNVIDSLLINLDNLQLGADFTEEMTFTGFHNISHMTMSFRVECSPGFCGPDCTTTPQKNPQVATCQADGTLTCTDNRLDPSPLVACSDCLYNLDITTGCSTCVQTNYDPTTNCTACLKFYDTLTNCTQCLPNRDPSTDCTQCLPNRDPSTNCTQCLPNRDPSTDCTQCLLNRDPSTNCTQCLPNRDPSTNCTQCLPNRDPSTDCTQCLPNRDSSTDCTQCLPNRDPSTNCTQCLPGWDITSDCTSCLPNRDPVTNCSLCLQPDRFTDADCSVCALPGGDPATLCQTCLDNFNPTCTECVANYDLNIKCSSCLLGYDSNRDCAVCLSGRNISTRCTTCLSGFTGSNCEPDSSLSVGLVGGIAGVLLLIILVMAVLLILLTVRIRKSGNQDISTATTTDDCQQKQKREATEVIEMNQNPVYSMSTTETPTMDHEANHTHQYETVDTPIQMNQNPVHSATNATNIEADYYENDGLSPTRNEQQPEYDYIQV